ncbi:MAG: DUF3499 domain-containing protein [Corynebacterium provencense]|jgi:hypothetical protein|uniref:DUF3499 family protein n=1 Tax=Corynebacterium provencense TaxID=1737425 RepID=UPI002989CD66|nr:DUF3499 domain-containing protein [Corynebacterium provencense]
MSAVTDYRQCSRPGCSAPAVATLRYNYRASRATVTVLGPAGDPHSWDLCSRHVTRLTVPEGWELVRQDVPAPGLPGDADLSDFTDEEMEVLAAALEAAADGGDRFGTAVTAPTDLRPAQPAARIVRREDIPRPTGHHPSRGNLPRHTPPRHLHAVKDGE